MYDSTNSRFYWTLWRGFRTILLFSKTPLPLSSKIYDWIRFIKFFGNFYGLFSNPDHLERVLRKFINSAFFRVLKYNTDHTIGPSSVTNEIIVDWSIEEDLIRKSQPANFVNKLVSGSIDVPELLAEGNFRTSIWSTKLSIPYYVPRHIL